MKVNVWFDKLESLQKVQMYFIPLLLFTFLFINSKSFYKDSEKVEVATAIINNQKYNEENILKFFQKTAKKNKIKDMKIVFSKDKITISLSAKFKSTMKFFTSSKRKYKILSYNMSYKVNKVFLEIQYDNKIYTFDNTNDKKHILKNPFKKYKNKRKSNTRAIIGNFVYIKSKWYSLNDKYESYKISEIHNNYIILTNETESIKMEIFNEK